MTTVNPINAGKPLNMYKQQFSGIKWNRSNKGMLVVFFISVTLFSAIVSIMQRESNPIADKIVFYTSLVFTIAGMVIFWFSLGRLVRVKKIGSDIRLQEELFSTTLSSISEGLITTGKSGEILYMNLAAENMTGWKTEEARKRPLEEVYRVSCEETGNRIECIANRILRQGNAIDWENNTVLLTKENNKLIISNSGFPLLDNRGNMVGAALVFNNNSANKVIEAKLEEREKQYRDLIQNLPEAVYTCDEFGYIQLYNKAAASLWGREPVPGNDLWRGSFKMSTPEGIELNDTSCPMVMAIKEQKPMHGKEVIIVRPDGSARHSLAYATPLFNAEGKLTGAVNMLLDVTEKREREILIKQTEEKYRTLIEQATDAVVVYSLDGTIYEFNEAAHTHAGYTRDEFARLNLSDLLFDEPIIINEEYAERLKAGEALIFSRRLKRKDGSALTIELSGRVLPDGRYLAFVRDVTERKKAERALKESEAFTQSILSSITAHIGVVNKEGVVVAVNNAWNEFSIENTGTAMERAAKGDNYFEVCEKAAAAGDMLAARALAGIQQVLRKELSFFEMEYPCHSATEQRWFLLRVTNFVDAPKVVVIHINITERKKIEEALQQSNERYELVTKATSDMIWDWDLLTGKVYRSKEGWKEIFKVNSDQECGTEQDWESRVHPDDLEKVRQKKQEIISSAEQNFFDIECRMMKDDGEFMYVHDKGFILRNPTGRPIRLIGASSDITSEKIAAELLKSSEERYRSLFNNSPAGIYIWDIDTLQILEVNDTAVQQYGYTQEEFTQLTILDLRLPEDYSKVNEFIKLVKSNPSVKAGGTWKHIDKSGKEMFCSIVSHQIAYKGKMAMMAMAKNVTDRVLLAEQLEVERTSKQYEITEAVLSAQENERQEIGRELHDNINQILASSRLYVGMAKKDKKNWMAFMEEADDLINVAITEVRSLSHSLIAPAISESALTEALDDIAGRTAETTQVIVKKNFYNAEEKITSDKFKLTIYRIVQEQFNNILKYAKATTISLDLICQENEIVLSVKDDGVGFETGKSTDGVGLKNIKTRASLFDGQVDIISSPGHGCELKVVFPFTQSINTQKKCA